MHTQIKGQQEGAHVQWQQGCSSISSGEMMHICPATTAAAQEAATEWQQPHQP